MVLILNLETIQVLLVVLIFTSLNFKVLLKRQHEHKFFSKRMNNICLHKNFALFKIITVPKIRNIQDPLFLD